MVVVSLMRVGVVLEVKRIPRRWWESGWQWQPGAGCARPVVGSGGLLELVRRCGWFNSGELFQARSDSSSTAL